MFEHQLLGLGDIIHELGYHLGILSWREKEFRRCIQHHRPVNGEFWALWGIFPTARRRQPELAAAAPALGARPADAGSSADASAPTPPLCACCLCPAAPFPGCSWEGRPALKHTHVQFDKPFIVVYRNELIFFFLNKL